MTDDRQHSEARAGASADRNAAIANLVEHEGPRLRQVALRFCGHPDDADELVQEVFLQAHRSWDDFRGDSAVSTWLYRIAARICQRMHRRRSGEPERIGSLNADLPFGEPRIAMIAGELEHGLQRQIRAEARERLEAAITRLPDEFRVPLLLKEIVGFSVREVADVLDLEEGTVRSRVHRARLRLRVAVDAVIPRTVDPVPPPAYDEQTCLDLLGAKQDALDRGVPFDASVICQRCQSVFASLDLTQDVCRQIAADAIPAGLPESLRQRIHASITDAAGAAGSAAESGDGRPH